VTGQPLIEQERARQKYDARTQDNQQSSNLKSVVGRVKSKHYAKENDSRRSANYMMPPVDIQGKYSEQLSVPPIAVFASVATIVLLCVFLSAMLLTKKKIR
jgi:hypothetical protein